jgi:hypothetical protein
LSDGKPRSTANVCTPGTNIVMNGSCTRRTARIPLEDLRRRPMGAREVLVHGDELIRHMIDGQTVLEYTRPQIGGGSASPTDPR